MCVLDNRKQFVRASKKVLDWALDRVESGKGPVPWNYFHDAMLSVYGTLRSGQISALRSTYLSVFYNEKLGKQ